MKNEDWIRRWDDNRIGFHQDEFNTRLLAHIERVAPNKDERVLVPLCGKTKDLVYLRERGHKVVGIEVAQKAVDDFFSEAGLSDIPKIGERPDHRIYQVPKLSLWCGDFFGLSKLDLGPFDVIYDRASIVALPKERRGEYASKIANYLEPGGRLLMVTFHYDQSEMKGPPFSVTNDEVNELFSDGFEIELLGDDDISEAEPRWKKRGLSWVRVGTFLLTKKSR